MTIDGPTPSPDRDPGSITRLIPALKAGDRAAVAALWDRYFRPLAAEAGRHFPAARWRAHGPEDVVVDAFLDFCNRVARPDVDEKFPRLSSRDHVWKLLVCFTIRGAFDLHQKEKRRANILAGESALGDAGFDPFAGKEPAPEFAAGVAELLDLLDDPARPDDDKLRRIALLRIEGLNQQEIADRVKVSLSTVERKLAVIRTVWAAALSES